MFIVSTDWHTSRSSITITSGPGSAKTSSYVRKHQKPPKPKESMETHQLKFGICCSRSFYSTSLSLSPSVSLSLPSTSFTSDLAAVIFDDFSFRQSIEFSLYSNQIDSTFPFRSFQPFKEKLFDPFLQLWS